MAFDDPLWVGLVAALVGAGLGWLGNWLLERSKERRSEARAGALGPQEKVHQLEVRIVSLERDMVHAMQLAQSVARRRSA